MNLAQIKEMNHRLDKYFAAAQAFVVVLTALFGFMLSAQLVAAADEVKNSDKSSFEKNMLGKFIEDDNESGFPPMEPGMMLTTDLQNDFLKGCQAYVMVGDKVNWKFEVTVMKENLTIVDYNKTLATVTVGQESMCPVDSSYSGDCRFFTKSKWQTNPKPENRLWAETIFITAAWLMPFWVAMKLISLDTSLVDGILARVCCGMGKKGMFTDLMLDFDCCEKCKTLQSGLVGAAKYFRFKIASNFLLLPLTTIGYNPKCPSHLFTAIPSLVNYRIVCALVILDLFYLLTLYMICSRCEKVKTYKCIYFPFLVPLIVAVIAMVQVWATSGFTLIFGFNFSIAFNIDLSFSLGMFSGLLTLLSFLEIIGFARMLLKGVKKVVTVDEHASA